MELLLQLRKSCAQGLEMCLICFLDIFDQLGTVIGRHAERSQEEKDEHGILRIRVCLLRLSQPDMRETIYIQAGPISNLVGAHFFATQFSYYPLDDSEESPVDLETCLRNVDTQNVRRDVFRERFLNVAL